MVSSADPAVSRRDFAAGETGRGPFIPTNRASNPRAGQWTNAMSHNMIADYKRFLMTDGEGIRCSLYVSADLSLPYVQGITFLGGEPLLNTGVLLPLSRKIRERFGRTKDIWCWTGYTWEELMREGESPDKRELLEQIDILVDGRYIKDLHDSLLQFRGSSNQRIIDVPKSLESGQVVLWSKLHDQTRFIPEIYGKDRAAGEGAAS